MPTTCAPSAGLEAGLDADDLVAQELGKRRSKDLSGVMEKYKDKVKAKLTEVSSCAALSASCCSPPSPVIACSSRMSGLC